MLYQFLIDRPTYDRLARQFSAKFSYVEEETKEAEEEGEREGMGEDVSRVTDAGFESIRVESKSKR